jgi:phytoene dehydrogenase-like protein
MSMTDEELIAAMEAALERHGVKARVQACVQVIHPMRRVVVTMAKGNPVTEHAVYDAEFDLIESGVNDVVFDLKIGG